MDYEQKLFAIREVSEQTGVKPVTLRAWQRRYSLIKPRRTDKGHRLYTQQNIDSIREIQSWLAKGVSIGKVKALLVSGDETELNGDSPELALNEVGDVLQALADLNRSLAETIIATILKEYPLDIAGNQFVFPVIEALENVKGPLRSLQRGLFQTIVVAKISSIIEAENKAASKGKCMVISLDPIESLYAWLWGLSLSEQGYKISLLVGVEDMSGLLEHPSLTNHAYLSVFSNRPLGDNQVSVLRTLQQQMGDNVFVSDVIKKLHPTS